jgi:hypothetical protein
MTRRDFVLIAETLARADIPTSARRTLAVDFAVRLKATNVAFDVDRFLAASVPEGMS